MKNKIRCLKITILIVISVIIIAGGFIIYASKNVITKNDVIIKAIATEENYIINDKNNEINKDIKVDISLEKIQKGDFLLYIVIENTDRMTFDSRDRKKEEYYVPNNIGSDDVSDKYFKELVKSNKVADISPDLFLKAIPIPIEKGTYNLRTYLNKTDDFVGYNNPVVVCIYYIDILGLRYTWSKIVPIETAK